MFVLTRSTWTLLLLSIVACDPPKKLHLDTTHARESRSKQGSYMMLHWSQSVSLLSQFRVVRHLSNQFTVSGIRHKKFLTHDSAPGLRIDVFFFYDCYAVLHEILAFLFSPVSQWRRGNAVQPGFFFSFFFWLACLTVPHAETRPSLNPDMWTGVLLENNSKQIYVV